MKNFINISGIIALFIIGFSACEKAPANSGSMTVKMKNTTPNDYDSVNIEVLRVDVHFSGNQSGWVTLPTNAGMYNLLELQNDVTAVLTSNSGLTVGPINQMRLILGDENYVVIDQISSPLELTSQDKNGLKFNLGATINNGDSLEVLIDFDTEKSIVVAGNGSFKLKPVIAVEDIIYH